MKKSELKKAYEEGLISEEKYKEELFAIETAPKQPKKPKRIYEGLSSEEFVKLQKATPKLHHKTAFGLSYSAGLRIDEVINLKPEDVDLKLNKIFIRQGKGSKDRIVNKPKWFKEKHLKVLPFKIKARALEAVFQRNSFKCGINRQISSFKRAGKDIPIFKYHYHCLRHGYCRLLFKQKVPPNIIQQLMGHDNLATTTKYSKESSENAIQAAMEAGL